MGRSDELKAKAGGRVTIAAIAQEAGVSLPTVSKVVNGRSGVSEETRRRVQRLLETRGYVRRGHPSRSSDGLVELLLDDLETPWSQEILHGAIEGLAGTGISPIVSTRASGKWDARPWLERVIAHRSAGVLLCLAGITERESGRLRGAGIPLVVVDPSKAIPPSVPAVGSTDYAGSRDMTKYLLDLGHRRIGYVGGPHYLMEGQARFAGFRSALESAGVQLEPGLISEGEHRYEDGYKNGRRLLGLRNPPTAIFAASDMQAAGVYAAAWEMGRRIPTDVSVVGFDDFPTSTWLSPPLTTVHHGVREMAKAGAETLVRLLRGSDVSTRMSVMTSLVVRKSAIRLVASLPQREPSLGS